MYLSSKLTLTFALITSPMGIHARLGHRDLLTYSGLMANVTIVIQPNPLDDQDNNRIVGGQPASIGEYKYYVDWDGGCGGSLIAPDIVLTAAHCDGDYPDVVVGAYNAGMQADTQGAVAAKIVDRRMHPQYSASTDAYDILLLKLDTALSQDYVVDINRADNVPSTAGETLTVIGLGATSEGGSASSTLLEVNVPFVPHNTCNQQYGGGIVQSVMLCAGTGGRDSCQGDSGGPIVKSVGGRDVQVGVVSFGDGCARAGSPGGECVIVVGPYVTTSQTNLTPLLTWLS